MFDLIPFRNRGERGLIDEDEFFSPLLSDFFGNRNNFRTDVRETKDKYVIEAELPGMKKEDINIEIDNNYLTITAKRSEVKEEKKEDYIRKERRSGQFARSFHIENVKEDGIQASYEDGLLKVDLPKKEPTTVNKRTIDIE